jgi:hypothetical protein
MKSHTLLCHPYQHMTKDEVAQSIKVRTARLNALKSTGPRTPAGKAVSARNAFKHGFAGANLTIDESEKEAFDDHLDAYFLRFKPQDQVEADSVRRIAEAQWKMDIINATENAIMSLEGGFQMCLVDARLDPNQVTVNHYRALALIEQSEGRAIDLCHRYYVSAAREYDRAMKTFYRLRQERTNDAAEQLVPELLPTVEADPTPVPQEPEKPKKPNEPTAPALSVVKTPVTSETTPESSPKDPNIDLKNVA